MTGIDRSVNGLNQDVFQALRQIKTTDGIDAKEAQTLKTAIEKDGQIDEAEADLLQELTGDPFKVSIHGQESAGFSPTTLYFGQAREKLSTEARGTLQGLITQHFKTNDTAFNAELKAVLSTVGDGNLTPEDLKKFSTFLDLLAQMPPDKQKSALPELKASLIQAAQGKGQVDEAIAKVQSYLEHNPIQFQVNMDELTRLKTAAKSEQTLDLAHSMSGKDYNRFVFHADQYFVQTEGQLQTQMSALDAQITQVKAATPVNQAELKKLEKLKHLTQALLEVHAEIKKSDATQLSNKYEQSSSVIEKVADARRILASCLPEEIGAQNYQRMDQVLQDYTAIALSFPEQHQHPDAVGKLNSFYLQVYKRVQQLESGQRTGFSKDVSGAIQTYASDLKMLMHLNQEFGALDQKLAQGGFSSEQAFVDAHMALTKGTSDKFQESVASLARAKWYSQQGRTAIVASEQKLTEARGKVEDSAKELVRAQQNLYSGSVAVLGAQVSSGAQTWDQVPPEIQELLLNDSEMNQCGLSVAKSTLAKAEALRKKGEEHLQKYEELKAQGGTALAEAEKYKASAVQFLDTSDRYVSLVKSGGYAQHLKAQTDAVDQNNAALRQAVAGIEQEVTAIKERTASLEKAKTALQGALTGLGNDIKFEDLDLKAKELAAGGIEEIKGRINQALLKYGSELEPATQEYLRDPQAFMAAHAQDNSVANVREDLQKLFKKHPELADTVAQEMRTFHREVGSFRADLEQQLTQAKGAQGAATDSQTAHEQELKVKSLEQQLRKLDAVEHRLVDGWLAAQGTLMEALMQAGGDSDQVKASLEDMTHWVEDTQQQYGRRLLDEPEQNAALAKDFERSLERPDMQEFKEKITATTQKFGQPVQTVPMVMVMKGTGAMLSFNAYVYKTRDGYMALNPLDKNFYEVTGKDASPEAALAKMAKTTRLADATLQYKDNQGVHKTEIQPPEDTSTTDGIMAGVGFVAGVALLLIPEPTVSKAAAVACFTASAAVAVTSTYFVVKGASKMADLYANDNLGWNKDTGMAAFDVGMGILSAAGGVGSMGKAAMALKAESSLLAYMSKLAPLAESKGFTKFSLATGLGAGLPMAGYQIAEIASNNKLSSTQKQTAIAQIVLFTATPLVVAGALALSRRAPGMPYKQSEMQETHALLQKRLTETSKAMDTATLPEVQMASKQSLREGITLAKEFYNSIGADAPPELLEIKTQGLKQIEILEGQLGKFAEPPASVPTQDLPVQETAPPVQEVPPQELAVPVQEPPAAAKVAPAEHHAPSPPLKELSQAEIPTGTSTADRPVGPDPDLSPIPAEKLRAARLRLSELKPGEKLSAADAQVLLQDTALAAHEALLKSNPNKPAEQVNSPDGKQGACGFGQAATAFRLEEMGIPKDKIHPHQAANAFGKDSFRHAFLTVDMPDGKTYLVDTTFRQFFNGEHMGPNQVGEPGSILRSTPEGQMIADKLLRDGFIELTDEVAHAYGNALRGGAEGPPISAEGLSKPTVELDFDRPELAKTLPVPEPLTPPPAPLVEAPSATSADTQQHVHEGGTETDPSSPYQGKWDGSGIHSWQGIKARADKDGFTISAVKEDPLTGARRVTVKRTGLDPKTKQPVSGEVSKTVYPSTLKPSEIDVLAETAFKKALAGEADTKLEPFGTKTRKDGTPADGFFEASVTLPNGSELRIQGWFKQKTDGSYEISSHAPRNYKEWPSLPEDKW
ncbi:hypothetical protein COW36_05255 [bacterium (Candidatus Blackallbacteria) CG17_big_fil_post_rev_8_21_14_2_50_48_46]|uniref:DUF4781 domain-containing protein n=1 Tax=bacterium (Candidatus Blackallbacteria) CG17_big_fil_post_rev_8_21_14_2_50_48_46 TaxID=2014261 RepID=A0A2M7GA07_9BACT|nr:MAG: hypothetical protein COW64_03685 [bacterium (Candidatus Blackallbacteria) CG18_big_fil_WC_8_21_14_2_50_49_26]PIW18704.1 MAG: hypothetical protein COW36_05255 [bacterium (Candidatus Blackallbacteria) CG17_big_fil_post_rev_8_21_14_2_50_48_46]PIW46309.1 MAG: hypothetical protein COW20_15420 [bacterium (Candidatus Blackallbacteria) CG13_big_fil_rev_8_21_14_2_50_49_14]